MHTASSSERLDNVIVHLNHFAAFIIFYRNFDLTFYYIEISCIERFLLRSSIVSANLINYPRDFSLDY